MTPSTDTSMLTPLLKSMEVHGGSDLHVKGGVVPKLRIKGSLTDLNMTAWTDEETLRAILEIMPPLVHSKFRDDMREVDFAVSVDGVRFRACAFHTLGKPGVIFRMVPRQVKGLDALHLPADIAKFAKEHRGLVLVTGPTGSGKTTTLSAIIQLINAQRAAHIITLEDPVEIVHQDNMSTITQREIGVDTASYADAVRSAMRQDPDVMLIGELRDAETARAALSAAETGHLVLSTMHTSDAQETVNRFIDLFPADEREHIRVALSANLKGVVAQRLLETADGQGRVPCCEVLVNTVLVAGAIADPAKTRGIGALIEKGNHHGMRSFEQSLLELLQQNMITHRTALSAATDPNNLKVAMYSAGISTE